MTKTHPLVKLARRTIEVFIREGREIEPPADLSEEMARQAGAFVTIRRHGSLRGCIGTIHPVHSSLAEEVIHNAISAATRDPRFPPVRRNELHDLDVKVDVMGEPELVESMDELDPKRYGLIVQSVAEPWRRGLLLPDLEGIDTVEKQVQLTRQHKAGITEPDEPVHMYRFEVIRLS
jgi:AmmeMemoRadiSam system protein A